VEKRRVLETRIFFEKPTTAGFHDDISCTGVFCYTQFVIIVAETP